MCIGLHTFPLDGFTEIIGMKCFGKCYGSLRSIARNQGLAVLIAHWDRAVIGRIEEMRGQQLQ